jgi:hypothetical protein
VAVKDQKRCILIISKLVVCAYMYENVHSYIRDRSEGRESGRHSEVEFLNRLTNIKL